MAQINLRVWLDEDGNYKLLDTDSNDTLADNLDSDQGVQCYNLTLNFPDTEVSEVAADITKSDSIVTVKVE